MVLYHLGESVERSAELVAMFVAGSRAKLAIRTLYFDGFGRRPALSPPTESPIFMPKSWPWSRSSPWRLEVVNDLAAIAS
jgi:hypothetical protein